MTDGICFNNEKYIRLQSEHIMERIDRFGNKLYLEIGGKLFDDYHASRVLPGFQPDSKIRMLLNLKEKAEIIIAISAVDIEKNKVRADLGISYDLDVIRLIDAFRDTGLYVGSVVISKYAGQYQVDVFKKKLENRGMKVYLHYPIPDYPHNVPLIVSENGFGRNDYIETTRPLVIVTAPGPGSGKMATCLSQLYHEHKHGVKAGYAKLETFPIWSLPLKHPVNLAYEAATADLNDVNMIDPFHLEAYGITAVNYNRDVEAFPILNAIFERILNSSPYKSPTDMGVNMAGFCIEDDELCREACYDEIVFRYYKAMQDRLIGRVDDSAVYKIETIMSGAGITTDRRPVIRKALEKAEQTNGPAAALELKDGTIVTGKTSELLGAASAMLLNALKIIAGVPDEITLISREVLEPIANLKTKVFGNRNPRLHMDETLIALSISAINDPNAKAAYAALPSLRGTEMHSSVILSPVDDSTVRKMGIRLTCEPVYQSKKSYRA
ncbi:MAG: DUF1846 domain-containing protein [Clostridia bacterium]|nr:DUF1846 domain-containing protein [Clostridia bacterium]